MGNSNKVRGLAIVLLFALFLCGFAFAPPTKDKELDYSKIKVQIYQIESSYKLGKEKFAKEDYLTAIANFNRVVELEKGSYLVYTPDASKYIEKAQAKLKEIEEARLKKIEEAKVKLDLENSKKAENKQIQAKEVSTPTVNPKNLEYTIGIGDTLFISVWREETLNQEVIVRPDGRISVILAGDIYAEGLTFNQLKEEISKNLKDYIKFPEVSVTLRDMGGKRVIVLGEVRGQGIYKLKQERTILEAIALAGGFTNDAVRSSVILVRGWLQRPEGIRLNLSRIIDQADMSQNVALQSGDIVYVPKTFISDVNYTLTQVVSPLYQAVFIRDQVIR